MCSDYPVRQQRQVLGVVMCETLGFKPVAFCLHDLCVYVCPGLLVCLCVCLCVGSEDWTQGLGHARKGLSS